MSALDRIGIDRARLAGVRCLVVIPARNEADTVGHVASAARAALCCDVVVVNDASSDATAAAARQAGATVLNMVVQLGAWGAVQAGLRYASRRGYTHVLTMDADGQHHADTLPCLLEQLRHADADVIIGSCEPRLSGPKRVAWWYFRRLTGIGVRDFTSGLRIYNTRALHILASAQASLIDYQDIGVLMLLKSRGLYIREVATRMSPRRNGVSRVFSSWWMVVRYMAATTVLCIARVDRGPGTEMPTTRSSTQ